MQCEVELEVPRYLMSTISQVKVRMIIIRKKFQIIIIINFLNLLFKYIQDIMMDPVVIESGHTYNKNEILQYFREHPNMDPQTK